MKHLLNAGVVIRDQTHFKQLPQHLRISVGVSEDMQEILNHLRGLTTSEPTDAKGTGYRRTASC